MNTNNVDHENPETPVVPSPYVEKVTEALAAAGHSNPDGWKVYLESDALITNNDDVQRFLINRALRLALSQASVSTMDERYCLVDTGDVPRWFELVQQKVVPCMVQHSLPPTT